ncbi:MAG: 4Fe-4S binding protein [Adlercreutzia equolifaciens]
MRRCIGCGYCALSCPYRAPKVDHEAGHRRSATAALTGWPRV